MIIVSRNDVTYIHTYTLRSKAPRLLTYLDRYVPIEIKQLELMIPRGRHYVILRARARARRISRRLFLT